MKPLRIGNTITGAFLLFLFLPAQAQMPPEAPPPGIRVAADGVFVRVLVTDRLNRCIAGLSQENFRIYENGALQKIHLFTQQSAPISIGIILDQRGSLKNELENASAAIYRWLSLGNPDDEFFLIWFDKKMAQLRTFSRDELVPKDVPLGPAGERTAFSFASSEGLDLIRKGKTEKKALVLIAEGEAAGSQAFGSEVGRLTRQSEVQLFSIARKIRLGNLPSLLPGMTGIRDFLVGSATEIGYYLKLIQDELRNQYVLGYSPPGNRNDGKWRKIEVKLNEPQGLPDLNVRVSKGYYAGLK